MKNAVARLWQFIARLKSSSRASSNFEEMGNDQKQVINEKGVAAEDSVILIISRG